MKRFLRRIAAIDNHSLTLSIIGLNTAVFAGWHWAEYRYKQNRRDTAGIKFMDDNFTVSLHGTLGQGKWWTLVTHTFSHRDTLHLLANMFSFYSFAPAVMDLLGQRRFLAFYGAAGVVAAVGQLAYQRQQGKDKRGLGASGAITALISCFATFYPRTQIYLMGVLPVPALVLTPLYIAYDYYNLSSQGGIGHAAHISGALFGLACGRFMRGRLRFW